MIFMIVTLFRVLNSGFNSPCVLLRLIDVIFLSIREVFLSTLFQFLLNPAHIAVPIRVLKEFHNLFPVFNRDSGLLLFFLFKNNLFWLLNCLKVFFQLLENVLYLILDYWWCFHVQDLCWIVYPCNDYQSFRLCTVVLNGRILGFDSLCFLIQRSN